MLRILYMIFKDFGLDVAQIGLIGFLGWKIMNNHLHHIQESLNALFKKSECLEIKINEQSNRISKIEGKLE